MEMDTRTRAAVNNTSSEMSGFLALGELNCARAACPNFVAVDFWSGLLVALDYYPIVSHGGVLFDLALPT